MGLAHRAAAEDDAVSRAHEFGLRAAWVVGGQRMAGVEGFAFDSREVDRLSENLGPDDVGDEVEATKGAAEGVEGVRQGGR